VRIGLTGVASDLGVILMDLLREDPRVTSVVSFGLAEDGVPPKTPHVETDLISPGADGRLALSLVEHRIDAVCHLAFVNSRIHRAAFAHELEVIGTIHVLSAVQQAHVKRLVIPSLTVVYGASKENPTRLKENAPLNGTGVRFVTDRVEVENQVAQFSETNKDISVAVLRFAPIAGPISDNPLTRMLSNGFLPTVLGHDPAWQVLHEDDAARALVLAIFSHATGAFNVVGPDVIPFSSVLRTAGVRAIPLPSVALKFSSVALGSFSRSGVPISMLDYLKFSFVADGSRAETMLGFRAEHDCSSALLSLHQRNHESSP
jgi:UDP-glucose 4-epimerase